MKEEGFNLYREARDYYDRIVPGKTDGLILLNLFEQYKNVDFSEEDVIRSIKKVHKDLGQGSTRNEYERNNSIILRLQDYYLWRDEIKKVYRFKPFGVEFCKRIHKRLEDSYSPAKIKRWFDELLNKLQYAITKEDGFVEWVEDHFDPRHTVLSEQIEILDQQVNESVKEFKSQIKREYNKVDIIRIIQNIEVGLDVIKQQALELKKAFQTTYDIDGILTEILEEQKADSFLEEIQRVRQFNDNVRSHLEQVSNRIEKIKPRIREFIYDFNQRDFDRKSELFLDVLLNHSSCSKTGGRIQVILPTGVPRRKIRNVGFAPKFTIIPIRELGPKQAIDLPPRTINKEQQKRLLTKAKAWRYEKDQVAYWTSTAFTHLEEYDSLDFAPLFFQILKQENQNLSIAVKTAHRVLKESLKNKNFDVQIEKNQFADRDIPNIGLWKMRILKK